MEEPHIYLAEGMAIEHTRFGEGKVLMYNDHHVAIKFKNEGSAKVLLRRFAKLKKI